MDRRVLYQLSYLGTVPPSVSRIGARRKMALGPPFGLDRSSSTHSLACASVQKVHLS